MKNTEEIISKFKQIRTLPHVAIRLVKMISSDQGNAKDYEEVIKYDPSLVMRVFKLVNSAYFALTDKVETLADAIVVIGQDNLRNMVVIEALRDIYKGKMKTGHFSGRSLWNHGVATSLSCKMIAEQIFGQKGEDAFLCGLMHDIGLIVEFQTEPELFDRMVGSLEKGVSFIDHENMVVGSNHCETGFWLAREWKLPSTVQIGIRDHHKNNEDLDPASITGIIQLGELIATRSGFVALPEIQESLSAPLIQHLRDNIDDYLRIQQELVGEMDKTKAIYSE
ncbi:MAG: HDOD domain-containing protein [Proteobacteria bacterium]|nr:HDOD domain-containing protein [Pseudomonadota bacterium]